MGIGLLIVVIGGGAMIADFQIIQPAPDLSVQQLTEVEKARAITAAEGYLTKIPERTFPLPGQHSGLITRAQRLPHPFDVGQPVSIRLEIEGRGEKPFREMIWLTEDLALKSYHDLRVNSKKVSARWMPNMAAQATRKAEEIIRSLFGDVPENYRFQTLRDDRRGAPPEVTRFLVEYCRYKDKYPHFQDRILVILDADFTLQQLVMPEKVENSVRLNPTVIKKHEALNKANRIISWSHFFQNNFRMMNYDCEAGLFVVYPNERWLGWMSAFFLIPGHAAYEHTHRNCERLAWVVNCESKQSSILPAAFRKTTVFIDAETGGVIGGVFGEGM